MDNRLRSHYRLSWIGSKTPDSGTRRGNRCKRRELELHKTLLLPTSHQCLPTSFGIFKPRVTLLCTPTLTAQLNRLKHHFASQASLAYASKMVTLDSMDEQMPHLRVTQHVEVAIAELQQAASEFDGTNERQMQDLLQALHEAAANARQAIAVLSLNTITITNHGSQAEKLHVTPQITAPATSLFGVTSTVDLELNHLSAKPGQVHVLSFSGFFSGSFNECHAYDWPSPGSADGDNTIIEAAPARPLPIFDDSFSTLNQKIALAMDMPASSQIALSLTREIHNCVGKNSNYDWKFSDLSRKRPSPDPESLLRGVSFTS
jgi:hypothetical protein